VITVTIDLDSLRLVKLNDRTSRKPCRTCSALDTYWAAIEGHEQDRSHMVRIDADAYTRATPKGATVNGGRVHACDIDRLERIASGEAVTTDDETTTTDDTTEGPKTVSVAKTTDTSAVAALDALRTLLGPQSVDADQVREMIKAELDGYVFPTSTVVIREGSEPRKIEGTTHKELGKVTRALLSGQHTMLVGPAGTGKSTIGEQAAEALGLPFYALSVGPQTSESKIFGYMDATGTYRATLFREAFENGGVFVFDEIDSGNPAVLTSINSALANGHCAFPDGMVKRHDDFRCVATANTYGTGPDRTFVGRQRMDGATLDRFAVLLIPVDEALEEALTMRTGLDRDRARDVLAYVRKVRANVDRHKVAHVVSPRATVGIASLIAQGDFTWTEAVDTRLRKGLTDQDWTKLTDGAFVPAWAK
jgi:cobaltochelatase CobS